jgi:hypothetical protein
MDDNALLAELERNLESEYGSDTQSVDSLSGIHALRSSSTNSPATQSAESSHSNRSKRNSIEDLFSSEKVQILLIILFNPNYFKISKRESEHDRVHAISKFSFYFQDNFVAPPSMFPFPQYDPMDTQPLRVRVVEPIVLKIYIHVPSIYIMFVLLNVLY